MSREAPRLSSLHARLSMFLLVLLTVLGGAGVISTIRTTQLHNMEVQQQLNLDLAHSVAAMKYDRLLNENGEPRQEGLKELFHWLMVVNPSVEFYLLDLEGNILGYDAAPGKVKRDRVSLEPIRALLAGPDHLPVLGEDPRHPGRRKIFSVSPIPAEGKPQGYLYIILASEQADSVAELLHGSYILRIGVWTAVIVLGLTAIVGLLMFHRLTRPLRTLAQRMRAFQGENPAHPPIPRSSDEVELLEQTFDDMVRRIHAQMDEIRRTEELRRELVANVSHDLRTPIAALQGYLDTLVLKKNVDLPAEERERYIEIALRQSERLGKLVEELFELSKLEAKIVEPQTEPFSIAELVQDNVQRYHHHAEQQGVRLSAALGEGLPFVDADLRLIERVLENLIENAVRHTPDGGSVTIRLRRIDSQVEVEVADTGCGIDADALPHIFDRFYRTHASNGEGAGLGLAITKRILELHGSEISVTSAVGEGTSFRFRLPIAR